MTENNHHLEFIEVEICTNPMESEIYSAALREAEIPHRTRWTEDGGLVLLVASGWQGQAKETLDRASQVFFNEKRAEHQAEQVDPFHENSPQKNIDTQESTPVKLADNDNPVHEAGQDDLDEPSWGRAMFSSDAMPTPEETRIRAVWPAWVLASVPGFGLGHLYAGKMQMFFYLLFCSLLGGLFFRYTGSAWSFGLVGFSWVIDLGFAAYHVKEHNRSAVRAKKRLEQAEQEFYDSLPHGGMNSHG